MFLLHLPNHVLGWRIDTGEEVQHVHHQMYKAHNVWQKHFRET